jgi:DHA1 family tetracycline resistance protein-like MFS transporter
VRHLDRDLRLLALANLLFALGVGLYLPLLFVYAIKLGASGSTIGVLNGVMLAMIALGNIPGAWAARRFRLKPVIVAVWWLTVPAAISFYLAPSWPWLIPGLVISGLYMANNPAFKAYVYLRSEPSRVARNLTIVFGTYPLGLVVSPLLGGYLAERFGMQTVFLLSLAIYIVSATTATMIRDTPYHGADAPLSLGALRRNRRFHRYVWFFLAGYLAVYVGQAFLAPYLAQVRDQGFWAIGAYGSLAALGAAVLTPAMGRVTDLYGPRAGIAGVLVFLLGGTILFLVGGSAVLWGLAMLACGSYDALRFVATGIVGNSFKGMPLAWGYAIFDTFMGLPMAGGAVLGGLLYRVAYPLPFAFVIAVSAALLAALLASWRRRPGSKHSGSGREAAQARH